ncbi:MAG: phospho-N-acetylmuramoyl-pentapeptide-transferase [Actinomycetota bacterium]|nr:phospho-N-acetylmuramoyl-pentapeptide-transferase [Actinomycetota bacterium]
MVLSMLIVGAITPIHAKLFRSRKIGQVIRSDGPEKHLAKSGTPTMGGLAILLGILISFFTMSSLSRITGAAIFLILSCGLIGFIDDYLKVLKTRTLGITAKVKMLSLFAITVIFGVYVVNFLNISTMIDLPLTGISISLAPLSSSFKLFGIAITIPWLFLLLLFLVISGTTNTVNLTDGLDGLAAGTATIVILAYAAIVFRQNNLNLAILCAAISGACIGFLWYNAYPADIFMGDTGSFSLGAAIAAMAILTKTELLLPAIGGIYLIEGLSVILQVFTFRFFKKRIFKMAPIHHHFEMIGWSETKIMIRFWIVTGILAGAGFSFYFMTGV